MAYLDVSGVVMNLSPVLPMTTQCLHWMTPTIQVGCKWAQELKQIE